MGILSKPSSAEAAPNRSINHCERCGLNAQGGVYSFYYGTVASIRHLSSSWSGASGKIHTYSVKYDIRGNHSSFICDQCTNRTRAWLLAPLAGVIAFHLLIILLATPFSQAAWSNVQKKVVETGNQQWIGSWEKTRRNSKVGSRRAGTPVRPALRTGI